MERSTEINQIIYNPFENNEDINAESWWYMQPNYQWLKISDIPGQIFYSIWNEYLESKNVLLHMSKPFYKKK